VVRALTCHRESSLSRCIVFREFPPLGGTIAIGKFLRARWFFAGLRPVLYPAPCSTPYRYVPQTARKPMTSAPVNAILFTVLLIAFVIIASLIVQRHRSLRLKRRFGPEYDLTVAEFRIQPGTEVERRTRHTSDQESDEHVF
jgi:hypothetical protein